jgi:type IV secretory pathway VirB10-like protein
MKGRMPFPDPLLPIALVVMVIAAIVPTCLYSFHKSTPDQERQNDPKTTSTITDPDAIKAPFPDTPEQEHGGNLPSGRLTTNKFHEVVSDEELDQFEEAVARTKKETEAADDMTPGDSQPPH